jgi:hypothetical protein
MLKPVVCMAKTRRATNHAKRCNTSNAVVSAADANSAAMTA